MSNIAGKAYAMNVITPSKPWQTWVNRLIFMVARGVTMENDKEILSDLDQQGGRRAVELEDEAQGVVSADCQAV